MDIMAIGIIMVGATMAEVTVVGVTMEEVTMEEVILEEAATDNQFFSTRSSCNTSTRSFSFQREVKPEWRTPFLTKKAHP